MASPDRKSTQSAPVLITGAAGALGFYFCSAWAPHGVTGSHIIPIIRKGSKHTKTLTVSGRFLLAAEEIDLADDTATEQLIAKLKPRAVVHCAALSDVDRCESDREAAYRDNVQATRSVVRALKRHAPDCHLVHISTDQVYRDGGGEHDQVGPINMYGWTKLWSEDIARQHTLTTILRLNYVGRGTPARPGLVNWMVCSLREKRPITLFEDVLFNPCHGSIVPQIAQNLLLSETPGTFNLGSSGTALSKAQFLLRLAKLLSLPTSCIQFGLLGNQPLGAPRNFDMSMDVSRTENILKKQLPSIEETLATLVEEWRKEELRNAS